MNFRWSTKPASGRGCQPRQSHGPPRDLSLGIAAFSHSPSSAPPPPHKPVSSPQRGLSLFNRPHVMAFIRLFPAIELSLNSHFRIVSNPSKVLHSLAQPFLLLLPPNCSNLSRHHSFLPDVWEPPHLAGAMSPSQLPNLLEIQEVCGGRGSHCGLSLFCSLILIYIISYLFKHLLWG